jgi:O-antigen ligase
MIMAKKRSKNKQPAGIRKPLNLYIFIGLMIILLPVLFSRKTIEPVLGIRMLAWNIFMLFMLVPLIFGYFEKKLDFGFLKQHIFKAFLLYFVIVIVSMIWAVNPAESNFDISKTLLSLVTLIVAATLFVKYGEFKDWITKAFVVSTLIAGLNGIFQYLQISPVQTETEMFATLYEIGGIMGHKNQFAISLFLLLPFAVFGIFVFRKAWFYLSILALLIIMVNIVLLQTRSVWVATIIFIFSSAVLMLFRNRRNSERAKSGILQNPFIIGFASFVLIAVVVYFLQSEETRGVFQYKISSLLRVDSHDNQGRLEIWGSTYDMVTQQPLTGVGAGNWKIEIPPYIAETHGVGFKNWNQPHNDFLSILSEKGIFGLLAYLSIFMLIFYYGFKLLRSAGSNHDGLFYLLMLSVLFGYFALAFVSFPYDRVNHQVVLMIIFAAIVADYYNSGEKPDKVPGKFFLPGAGVVAMLLIISLVYNISAWNTRKNIRMVYAAIDQNNPNAVVKYATDALNPWLTLDEQTTPIYKHRGTAMSMLGRQSDALQDLHKALEAHPNHVNTLVNIATIYAREKQYKQALTYFEQAMQLFPKNQPTIKSMARVYYDMGEFEKAYATILKYDNNKPDAQIENFRNELEAKLNAGGRK